MTETNTEGLNKDGFKWATEEMGATNERVKSTTLSKNKENTSPKKLKTPKKERRKDSPNWREPEKKTTRPKSKGIAPKSFYGRRGRDEVHQLHKTIHNNVKKEEINRMIKEHNVKRSAFREVTSLKTWPIQQPAMQDYQQLLAGHLHEESKVEKNAADSNAPEHEHGGSSSSAQSAVDTKRQIVEKDDSPNKSQMKNRFKDDFLLELNIPPHNVLSPSYDPATKFDPGLWSMEPRIFSVEKAKGKRKYLVGHLGRIMDFIWRKTDRCNRHLYELILEKTPCRLYFDLEYSKPDNPDIPHEELLDEFYRELEIELKTALPEFTENFDRTCIVDLDSSTPAKFSRHWIVHLPSQALFKDSQHAGAFVKRFIQRLADEVATEKLKERCPILQQFLFVNQKGALKESENSTGKPSKQQQKTCFVDLGVYTRNRLFRVLGSSKFGKTPDCALRIAESNQFPFPNGFSNECFYVPAMPSSQDSSDDSDTDDDENVQAAKEKFEAKMDWTLHAQALCSTLIVPMNATKIDYPILPEIENDANSNDTKKISAFCTSSAKVPSSTFAFKTPTVHHGQSPYPYLDDFVLDNLANRGGIQGSIRAWTLDYGLPMNDSKPHNIPVGVSFQMSRNRYCECVGRHHKSNNIMWNVDFCTKQCVQACYDPECRAMNFRGSPIDLPYEVAQQLEDALIEEQIAQMDESEVSGQAFSAMGTDYEVPANADVDGKAKQSIEQALQGLTLRDDSIDKLKSSSANAARIKEEGTREPTLAEAKQETNTSHPKFDDLLSDDALLDALSLNPELFP